MEQCYKCVQSNVTLDQAGTCRLAKSSDKAGDLPLLGIF